MRYALNKEGKRTSINNTHMKEEYYCPICGEKLVLRKGDIRKHHFSHMSGSNCNDGWHYDMSEWHTEWQSKFPEETQEVVKKYNNQKHRADVLIEKCKTVIEFQHSTLSAQEFQARNNFYLSLGYKVIWLFDVSSQYENYGIAELENKENIYKWSRPLVTFNLLEKMNDDIEIYFEFINENSDEECFGDDIYDGLIAKVSWVPKEGFERFAVDMYFSKKEFLMKFEPFTEVEVTYSLSEIYDDLKYLYSEDHTSYYSGCLLSPKKLCRDSDIDYISNDIKYCLECEHYNDNRSSFHAIACNKRINDLDLPKDTIIKKYEKYSNGSLKSIVYYENANIKIINFPELEHVHVGETILHLWEYEKPKCAIFKNTRTGVKVKITRNPLEMVKKYRKCYGYLAKAENKFYEESKEVYNFDKKEWVIVRKWL